MLQFFLPLLFTDRHSAALGSCLLLEKRYDLLSLHPPPARSEPNRAARRPVGQRLLVPDSIWLGVTGKIIAVGGLPSVRQLGAEACS
jgi:hypothetical protein